jgi:hypothetical protein
MRTQVYDDDIQFIREVKEGLTEAPDMDPNYELKNLSHRFEAWKRDFKQRLHEAKHMIKKLDRATNHQSAYSFASADTSFDVSEGQQDYHQNGAATPPPARRGSSGLSPEPHIPAHAYESKAFMTPPLDLKTNGYDSESSVANSVIGAHAYYNGAAEMSAPAYRVGLVPDSPPGDDDQPHADLAKKKKNGIGNMFKRVVSGR